MSASNGGLQSEVNNYFNTLQTPFPSPMEGKLDTLQFLDASKGVVSFIDMFGKVFLAVRYDMTGNIEKLTNVYERDREKFKYLHDMIICENENGGILATDALLWLKRGLHFFLRFFELILDSNHPYAGGDYDDLSSLLKVAYEETLYCHHSWVTQQLFKLLSQKCPNRTRIIKAIALNNENTSEDVVYRDMASFTSALKINVDNITQFYKDNDLDPSYSE